jgi:hypothetical protein
MVVTSRRCGTLATISGSSVSSAAVKIGSVAFLAPETATSPDSAAPPSMTSLSMARGYKIKNFSHREHREHREIESKSSRTIRNHR